MGIKQQLYALLYKDLYIRTIKRHYIATAFQLVIPLLLCVIAMQFGRIRTDNAVMKGPYAYDRVGPYTIFNLTSPYYASYQRHVLYAPNGTYAKAMMNIFHHTDRSKCNVTDVRGFESESELLQAVKNTERELLLAVIFGDNVGPTNLNYTLRFNGTNDFRTGSKISTDFPYSRHDSTVQLTMLYPVMSALFDAHVEYYNLSESKLPGMQRNPIARYQENPFPLNSYALYHMFFAFGVIVFVTFFTKRIIFDKASRLRELMRMMGLSDSVYWLTLFLIGMIFMCIISIICMITYCIDYKTTFVFPNTQATIVLFVLLVFSVATVIHVLLIATIFNGPTLGSLAAFIIWLTATMLPCTLFDSLQLDNEKYIRISGSAKLGTSLLPSSGLYWVFRIISILEGRNIGATWSNINNVATPGDSITILSVLSMMLISSVLHAILIFYLDAVIPWQYGVPKSPFFLFHKSYWMPSSTKGVSSSNGLGTEDIEMFEQADRNAGDPVVVLKHVTKEFGNKRALDNLSLSLYKNQITVLLGHNGAGKTTAMNILTGLFPPTTGDMFINGYSVRENTKKARESVGLCPQHNVLFDELTVNEHLKFFGSIKGQSAEKTEQEMWGLLSKFDLLQKGDVLSKDLSGGMKRKLSMANALIGGSQIVILDEPTAGMDPEARRGVWSILQEARSERTIMLTTHYMEEADVLGDRIAFLADGNLKCSGSPMFLKKKFETGYKMRVAKSSPSTDVKHIVKVACDFLGQNGCYLESDLTYEFCVNLGFPPTEALVPLFRHIEENEKELGISSLGVAVTTMEDVFIKVGQLEAEKDKANLKEDTHGSSTEVTFPKFQRDVGPSLLMLQFTALFMKRFNTIKRQWWMPVFSLVIPLLLCLSFCSMDNTLFSLLNPAPAPAITYTMKSIYGNTEGFIKGDKHEDILDSMKADGVNVDAGPIGNITEYLLEKAKSHVAYTEKLMMGVDTEDFTLWFNGEAYHAGAAGLVDVQTGLLREATTDKNATVQVTNRPFKNPNSFIDPSASVVLVRMTAMFPMAIAFAFLTCSLILFPIQENVSKAKLLQLMSGVNRGIFFGASFAFDFLLIFISSLAMLIAFLIYNPAESFTSFNDTWIAFLILLLFYGYAMISFSYLVSYMFKKPTTGFTILIIFTSLSGSILVLVMGVLDMLLMLKVPGISGGTVRAWIHIFNYLPNFGAVWGFINVHINGLSKGVCKNIPSVNLKNTCSGPAGELLSFCCQPCPPESTEVFCFERPSPFSFDIRHGIGFQLLAFFIVGTAMLAILILVESNSQKFVYYLSEVVSWGNIKKVVFRKSGPILGDFCVAPKDSDVTAEEEATDDLVNPSSVTTSENDLVNSSSVTTSGNALVVHHLSKNFGQLKAVNDVTFRVQDKECFGLLGVNGAGKTTTFGMLTGDLLLSSGNAYIRDIDLKGDLRKFQEQIGFCPQFDALLDSMTGREMLNLYCSLRGVPRCQVRETVDFMITMADLEAHADKVTQAYSGGNKRKLSIALALIGNPKVLFLDEPTAGIDPEARRKIWATLMMAQKSLGSAVVLTSHLMEECEALCNRLCIMVNGSFQCIGSSQHLKSKFGQGFTVLMKLNEDSVGMAQICNDMEDVFPGKCHLKENHMNMLHFHITDTSIRWSQMFEKMEYFKTTFRLEDVVVSDTTLEQIFLTFAKSQRTIGVVGVPNPTYA